MYIYTHAHILIYVCMCISIYICIYILYYHKHEVYTPLLPHRHPTLRVFGHFVVGTAGSGLAVQPWLALQGKAENFVRGPFLGGPENQHPHVSREPWSKLLEGDYIGII